MTIRIPVEADFDSSKLEASLQAMRQQINALGSQIAQANKVQFNPVGKTSLEDMRKMLAQFEALKRIQGDLNKRVKATGQGGANFFDLDWTKMYPDANSRARQMQKSFQYVTGLQFGQGGPAAGGGGQRPPNAPPSPNAPRVPPPGGGGPGVVGGIAQAGMRAAGPVGGVAANALGTGMSAGVGAGLMGLLGGIAALGVGKLVGMATENIGKAEDNAVAYDKLKRVLGDVGVSFTGLKTVIEGSASGLKVTFDEAARLGTQFTKLGNLAADQYGTLGGELRTGVGMSRAFGLDPAQGVGFLGQMRGMKQTQDEQGSRKVALLIGETIAKSGAFAKADEVMEAMSGYVTSQTRSSFGANASGFAGLFSSLVGSGIPGLDPMGASGLITRLNSSLSAGGAKGEASQFFTNKVGQGMGLDSLQTQLLRESGAFATNDQVFGPGSIYARSTGRTGPSGSKTLYGATMGQLRKDYSGSDPQARMLRAQAASNHLGISMTQALALDGIGEGHMGELEGQLKQSGVKIGDMNFAGLGNLAKVVSGSGADRLGVASELWSRTGKDKLTDEESSKLDQAMKSGSEQDQKNILSQLIASRDQEMTQGKDIRDSKTAVENIKVMMADQLIPITQSMRDGIMWMAGGKDGKSGRQVQLDLMNVEHRENKAGIYRNSALGKLEEQRDALQPKADMREDNIRMAYRDKPEVMAARLKERADAIVELAEIDKKMIEAKKVELKQINDENLAYAARKAAIDGGPGGSPTSYSPGSSRAVPEGWKGAGSSTPFIPGVTPMPAGGSGTPMGEAPASVTDPNGKMTRGYRNNNPGNLEATIGWKGMAGSDGRFAKFNSPSDGYQAMGRNLQTYNKKYGINTIRGVISRWAPGNENNVPAYIAAMEKEMGVKADDPLNMQDQETMTRLMRGISKHENGYVRHDDDTIRGAAGAVLGIENTPMPDGAVRKSKEERFKFDAVPVEVIHRNERGEEVRQAEYLSTRVRPATPFGSSSQRGIA